MASDGGNGGALETQAARFGHGIGGGKLLASIRNSLLIYANHQHFLRHPDSDVFQ